MTLWRLIYRNLVHFRAVNLAAILGIAIATAALSGALLVGDSVRQSLLDLALVRLGKIDHVLVTRSFFNADLAERVGKEVGKDFDLAPGILVRGAAAKQNARGPGISVQIIALGGDWAPVDRNASLLNRESAEAVDGRVGDDLVLAMPGAAEVPHDATLARRSRQDTLTGLRTRVASVIDEPGMLSLFSLEGSQRSPSSVWTNLADLQDAMEQPAKANLIVAHGNPASADALNAALRRVVTLDDYGLTQSASADKSEVAIGSRYTYLDPAIEAAADRVATSTRVRVRKISINLMNSVSRVGADGKPQSTIHYAVAAGISPLADQSLADDEIALNQWTADRLGAKVGDRVTFTFYRRQTDGGLVEIGPADRGAVASFRVAQVLPMTGIGADPALTPSYKGLTDTDSIADWDPPEGVKIDQKLVTDADEDYWKRHRASPKVFVSFATSNQLWGESFGHATGLRVPSDQADRFLTQLRDEIDPASVGLTFRAIRAEQIRAASGTTDFGQLFIAFSFFLIVAAVLLAAMLVRLGVEQRTRQLGALAALGFSPGSVRRMLLAEAMIVSVIGGCLGTLLAIGYTWILIAGLRTWWLDAVGTTAMRLHVAPMTLAIGFVVSQVVTLLAIYWAVRRAGNDVPARLLAGRSATDHSHRTRRKLPAAISLFAAAAGLAALTAGVTGAMGEQAAFLAGGGLLLVSGLALCSCLFGTSRGKSIRSNRRLAIRNLKRQPARAVLCIGLIALATFTIVTVSAMRQGEPNNTADLKSGSGGNQLIVESQIPLLGNPHTETGRSILGFRDPADRAWDSVRFTPLRRRAGQDVSCQTLTRAASPSVIGIPQSLVEQNGFRFASAPRNTGNPWTLLDTSQPDGAIPIFADANTAQYSLHIAPGDTIDMLDAFGQSRKLRLVATLAGSVFQRELLMSEASFRSMFPQESGFGTVLVRVESGDPQQIASSLREELGEYGARVSTTASLLASFLQVQNTYLSTFRLLGAMGLMLGTLGLAVVLVRTAIERKSESALLAAIGFAPMSRLRIVLIENASMLLIGIALGTVCALVGVIPSLRESARSINFAALVGSLAGATAIGLSASTIAAYFVGRRVTASSLRSE